VCNQVLINPIIRTRTRLINGVYHPQRYCTVLYCTVLYSSLKNAVVPNRFPSETVTHTYLNINRRRMRLNERVARTRAITSAYKLLDGKSEWKQPLGKTRRRPEDIIKVSLKKLGVRVWTGFVWSSCGFFWTRQ
jgi:hypothetical protein